MEELLKSVLGESFLRTMLGIGDAAGARGWKVHLVGGAVRDLLLGTRSGDIDLVVEGDAIALTSLLHSEWPARFPHLPAPGKPVSFPRYGTSKLAFKEELFPGVSSLDFATARSESYPLPGGRPIIQPGSLGR